MEQYGGISRFSNHSSGACEETRVFWVREVDRELLSETSQQFSAAKAAQEMLMSVRLSVCQSVTSCFLTL